MSIDASGITQEGPPRATAKKTEGVLERVNISTLAQAYWLVNSMGVVYIATRNGVSLGIGHRTS